MLRLERGKSRLQRSQNSLRSTPLRKKCSSFNEKPVSTKAALFVLLVVFGSDLICDGSTKQRSTGRENPGIIEMNYLPLNWNLTGGGGHVWKEENSISPKEKLWVRETWLPAPPPSSGSQQGNSTALFQRLSEEKAGHPSSLRWGLLLRKQACLSGRCAYE